MDEFILTNYLLLTVIMFTCWIIVLAVFFDDSARLPTNTLKAVTIFLTYAIMCKNYNIKGVNVQMKSFDIQNNQMILSTKQPQNDKYLVLKSSSSEYQQALTAKGLIK